jgi:hypothetical protein
MGQVGSHLVMAKPGARANLSIPQHKELTVGTLRALIRAAGMTVDEFLGLLYLGHRRVAHRAEIFPRYVRGPGHRMRMRPC